MNALCLLSMLGLALEVTSTSLVCYYANWPAYRAGAGLFTPDHIDPNLCTHIIYSFAVLDESSLTMKSHDPNLDLEDGGGKGYYKKVIELKQRNRNLKVLLAIGGWTDSIPGTKYSSMVGNANSRAKFIQHAASYLQKYGFDGLDLDWEYPKQNDKANFAIFVKELKHAFRPKGLLVTAAVAASKAKVDESYDVSSLSHNLDAIHLMAYDMHGQWETSVNYHAPMTSSDGLDVESIVDYWIQKGASANKLVLGLPMYGRSWTLVNANNNKPGSAARGGGQPGQYTKEAGILAYYEICNSGWQIIHDTSGKKEDYAYKGNQWVSFDDVDTIKRKCNYIKSKRLAGGMIWSLDQDDFNGGFCRKGKYPLLSTIKNALNGGGRILPPQPTHRPRPTQRPPTVIQPPSNTGLCKSGESGPVGHPSDCRKLVMCNHGRPHILPCPAGTKFSSSCKCCDWGSC